MISLPFNQFTVQIFTKSDNFTKYAGILLVIVFLVMYRFRINFSTPSSKMLFLFFLYTSILEMIRYLYAEPYDQRLIFSTAFQHYQLFGLYLVFIEVTKDKRVVYMVFDIFIITNILKAIIISFNIDFLLRADAAAGGRLGVLGENLNQTAILLSLTFFIILTRILNNRGVDAKLVMNFLSLGLLITAIVLTGSRGGAMVLIIGTVLILLSHFNTQQIFKYIVITSAIVYFAFTVISESILLDRIMQVFVEGETGMRLELAKASFALIKSNFWFGVGTHYPEILGDFIGKVKIQTHNTYLQLLLSFGILGFVLFMLGVVFLFRELYKNQTNLIGSTSLIIFIAYLFTFGTGGLVTNKILWVFYAIFANISIWNQAKKRTHYQTNEPTVSNEFQPENKYA